MRILEQIDIKRPPIVREEVFKHLRKKILTVGNQSRGQPGGHYHDTQAASTLQGAQALSLFDDNKGRVKGCPTLNMLRGNVVVWDGEMVAKPGLGRYILRSLGKGYQIKTKFINLQLNRLTPSCRT